MISKPAVIGKVKERYSPCEKVSTHCDEDERAVELQKGTAPSSRGQAIAKHVIHFFCFVNLNRHDKVDEVDEKE
jgi:hypothetical protein